MSYSVIIHTKAEKEIRQLHSTATKQVIKRIYDLASNPRPHGYKRLEGFSSRRAPGQACYRIRVGELRVIYTVEDEIITVTIIQVKKRGDIY